MRLSRKCEGPTGCSPVGPNRKTKSFGRLTKTTTHHRRKLWLFVR